MSADQPIPPFARELSDVLGWDAMIALCSAYGGLPLWVPRRLSPDSALPLHVGTQATEALIRTYGGTRIDPPKLTALQTYRRDEAIRREAASGRSMVDLARFHDMTVRHVRRIVST